MPAETGTVAIIYARRSGAEESKSIEDQERLCRAIPKVADCSRIEVIRDEAVSGGNARRPGLLALYQWLKDPSVRVLAFYHQDRLARDEEINAVLGRLLAARPDIHAESVEQGVVRLDAAGMLMWGIHGSFSAYYRRLVSERMLASYEGRRSRGRWTGALPPYGYVRSDDGALTVDEAQAAAIQRSFALSAEGYTFADIASVLKGNGYPKPPIRKGRVKDWTPAAVGRRLNERRYCDGTWPTLISPSLFEAVASRMRSRTSRPAKLDHTFRGICRCSECGSLIWWRSRTPSSQALGYCGSQNYAREDRCPQASHGIREADIVQWVDRLAASWERRGMKLAGMAAQREVIATVTADRLTEVERRIAALDTRLDAGTISVERFHTELSERRREYQVLQAQLAEADEDDETAFDDWPRQWTTGTSSQRRDLLTAMFDSLTIDADGHVVGYEPRQDHRSRVLLLVDLALTDAGELNLEAPKLG